MLAPVQFKDFTKESKDILTKNVQAPGAWKFETKFKAEDETFTVVPKSEVKNGKTVVSAQVAYASKANGISTEATIDSAGNVAPKVKYGCCGATVEVNIPKIESNPDVDVTVEGAFAGANGQAVVGKKQLSGMLSYSVPVLPFVTVGASGSYIFESKEVQNWSVGFRAAVPMLFAVAGSTVQCKTFTVSVMAPVMVMGQSFKVAVMADGPKDNLAFSAGCELGCPLGFFDSLRVRFSKTGEFGATIAAAKKMANGWTAAVTLDTSDIKKVGLVMTQE